MAKRRMFDKAITETERFIGMPHSAGLLYFLLGLSADDDGFVGNALSILRAHKMKRSALQALVDNGYLIHCDQDPEGPVYVIVDWLTNNNIRKDRYTETQYLEEKSRLLIHNNKYYLRDAMNCQTVVDAIDGRSMDKTSSLEKMVDLNSIPPRCEEVEDYSKNKGYSFDVKKFYAYYENKNWREGNKPINWRQKADQWNETEFHHKSEWPKYSSRPEPNDVKRSYERLLQAEKMDK